MLQIGSSRKIQDEFISLQGQLIKKKTYVAWTVVYFKLDCLLGFMQNLN